ncbi:MAG: hypothetical protein ACM3NV_10520 [Syntrophothermus sp.]
MTKAPRPGPVQVLVIGLDEPGSEEMLRQQLRRLEESGAVVPLDLLVVHRGRNGGIMELCDREAGFEGDAAGRLAAPLLGIFEDEAEAEPAGERWYLVDQIPPGSAAAIVLLEHRWAIPLRDAVAAADADVLGDAWVHPDDLATIRE